MFAITTTNTNTRKRGRGSGGQHFHEHFQFSLIRVQEKLFPNECRSSRSRSRAASPHLLLHNPDFQLAVFSFKLSLEALEWTQPRNSLCRSVASPHKKNKKESLAQDIHRILCVILLRYGGALQTLLPPRRLTSSTHQTPRPGSVPIPRLFPFLIDSPVSSSPP